ncbi:DUF2157 domain-containing protein [Oligoflexia bacterium]|nr:DUF2157 domain-containing protein [Oligoflexia bacterium]
MNAKQDAIIEVVDIIKRHGVTLDDITAALKDEQAFKAKKGGSILMRLFGYIGGLFVFAGLTTFVGMQWSDMDAVGHVMVTLGVGFCVFIVGLVCTTNEKLENAATPLFLLAALLQPAGILVTMDEFSRGGDPMHGALFMCFVMALQQGCTFWAKNRTVLAFTTLLFGTSFFSIAFELMEIDNEYIGIILGLSLTCIGWSLDHSKHKSLSGLCYLFGPLAFLCGVGDIVKNTFVEILFLGLSCGIIFLSTVVRSRTLLSVGTLATLGYIGYSMNKYFGHSLMGPIGLIIVGALLIGAGVVAVKINNKFIKQKG